MNNESIEDIREFFTLQNQTQLPFIVFVPHSIYKIKGNGLIRYSGNGIWTIDDIVFPLEYVDKIDKLNKVIYLK